jgi:hypothetical protein
MIIIPHQVQVAFRGRPLNFFFTFSLHVEKKVNTAVSSLLMKIGEGWKFGEPQLFCPILRLSYTEIAP